MKPSLLAVLTLSVVLMGCVNDSGFKRNQQLYNRVVEAVQKGEIETAQENGVKVPIGSVQLAVAARLPADLRQASVDGEVYVFRPSSSQVIVVFKTWRGKGFNMEGFLYAAKPLSSEAKKDYYGHDVVNVGPMELVLEKQLDSNWYRVSYKLD